MSESDHIRVGIVGAGRNTCARHIPGLRAIDRVEIVSVCNRTPESSRRVAQQFGIPTVYDNWPELVRAEDTDAIVIGSWPYIHCPVTLAALGADKHVLCEARMAMDAREARGMLDASRGKPNLVAQVVPAPLTLGVDATVKRLIREGYLGEVLTVDVREESGFVDYDAPMHWRDDFELSGANTMGLGIWYETLMRWIGEAVRVSALSRTFVKMRRDPERDLMRYVCVPDHLDAIADMACGAQARFRHSRVCGLGPGNGITLYGTEGTLCFTEGKLLGGKRGDSDLKEIPIPAERKGRWRVEEEFVGAIRGEEQVKLTTFEDGVKYMEFTEAVALSAVEYRAVSLPLRGRAAGKPV